MTKRTILAVTIIILLVITAVATYLFINHHEFKDIPPQPYKPLTDKTFNMREHSTTDPDSIWIVVNKKRPLKLKKYEPQDLVTPHFLLTKNPADSSMKVRREAGDAMGKMYNAAVKQNIILLLSSGYRSYNQQEQTHNEIAEENGENKADRESADSGYSEHQTGLAADIGVKGAKCLVEQCFADTDAGKWIASNAYTYGFIIRYPPGKEGVTGYEYEPWHIRYVGTELAAEMHNKHVSTLEEFFSLGPAPEPKS